MDVTPHASVSEFFHEVLSAALANQAVDASEPTESYLVGLLGEFTHARITDESLALKLAGAAEPGERVRALKEVGDTTLYMAGFFADSLRRGIVATDYYIGMGEAAYRELAHRLTGSSVRAVYEELSAKFPRFVDVLAEVSRTFQFAGADVVKLYEQWLATRDEWIERRLRGLGVLVSAPTAGGKVILQ